jgi:hypothetical protein
MILTTTTMALMMHVLLAAYGAGIGYGTSAYAGTADAGAYGAAAYGTSAALPSAAAYGASVTEGAQSLSYTAAPQYSYGQYEPSIAAAQPSYDGATQQYLPTAPSMVAVPSAAPQALPPQTLQQSPSMIAYPPPSAAYGSSAMDGPFKFYANPPSDLPVPGAGQAYPSTQPSASPAGFPQSHVSGGVSQPDVLGGQPSQQTLPSAGGHPSQQLAAASGQGLGPPAAAGGQSPGGTAPLSGTGGQGKGRKDVKTKKKKTKSCGCF